MKFHRRRIMRRFYQKTLRIIKVGIWAALGILVATVGLKGFLEPNHFIDGGVTGVSMLLSRQYGIELGVFIALLNIPFLFVGYKHIGSKFAIFGAVSIALLSLSVAYLPVPVVSHDKLLAAVFGGVCLGAGIGLTMRGGSVIDGTEVLSLVLSKKVGLTVGDIILIINIFIFGASFFVLNSVEYVLYSLLTYLAASRTIDFVLHGIEEYTGITIMSAKAEGIRKRIIEDTGRGVTIYRGKGGYTGADTEILFCVVTRLEIYKIKAIIDDVDPAAFMITQSLKEASGGMVKRRAVH